MQKLDGPETKACVFLAQQGGTYRPDEDDWSAAIEVRRVLDRVVKKKRAFVIPSDGGPTYKLTYQGIAEAAAHG